VTTTRLNTRGTPRPLSIAVARPCRPCTSAGRTTVAQHNEAAAWYGERTYAGKLAVAPMHKHYGAGVGRAA